MGATIEATLDLWSSSLRGVKTRIRPLFSQEQVASSAGWFLDGLLVPSRRKTGWMRAEAAGDPGHRVIRPSSGVVVGTPMCCASARRQLERQPSVWSLPKYLRTDRIGANQ